MNRRDVIIIAVLINAGLLVVMCASALKSGNNQPEVVMQKSEMIHTPIPIQNSSSLSGGDEVDQVLNQFATVHPLAQSSASSPIATPILPSSSSDMHNAFPEFSREIQSLASPEIPNSSSFSPPQLKVEKSEGDFKEIKVKKGDALEKIARTHHTTVQDLMRINHLTSTQLKIGQVLKISTKNVAPSFAAPRSTSSTVSEETRYYTVKNGDNPWTIAVKNHMKVDELLKLNGLDEEKARKLKPGDQLRIR